MNAVIKWTLQQRRLSIIGWSIGAFALIFLSLIVYPSFKTDADELQKTFDNLSETTVQFLGGSTDFFSPVGYLNSQVIYMTLPLLLGILAIALGSSLLARDEQDKTIEALLARPISRSRLLGAKSLAGAIILGLVTLVSLLATVGTAKLVDLDVPAGNIALSVLACFLLVLSFGAVAFVLSAIGKTRGASIGIATVYAFGGYIISSLAGTVEWLRAPSKLFSFYYYRSEQILRGEIEWQYLMFFVAVIALCGLTSWWAFRRRDLA